MSRFVWEYFGKPRPFARDYEARDKEHFIEQVRESIGDECAREVELTVDPRHQAFLARLEKFCQMVAKAVEDGSSP